MNKFQSFENFLSTQGVQVELGMLIINLLLAAAMGYTLARAYVRFGKSLSNRERFSRNFSLLAMTIMLIISIVKSSLSLSLGMVGALSIVRFRAAIKEPEELAFLFVAIAIGLGLGAEQTAATVASFVIILAVIVVRGMVKPKQGRQNLHITVTTPVARGVTLDQVVAALDSNCISVNLRRIDESADRMEASFWVEFRDVAALTNARTALRAIDPAVQISFLENSGLA